MTTINVKLFLGPDEFLTELVMRWASETNVAAGTTSTHHGDLTISTILLSEVEALELRVADRRRDLLELELVNLGVDGGQEPKKERGEDHGGWEETTRRRRKGCIARLESRRSRITSCASLSMFSSALALWRRRVELLSSLGRDMLCRDSSSGISIALDMAN